MKNEINRRIKAGKQFEDLIGLWGVTSLDNLLSLNGESRNQQTIPTYLICEVLNEELISKEVKALQKDVVLSVKESRVTGIPAILKKIPDKLYFFLWSLKNSEVLPQEGVMSLLN